MTALDFIIQIVLGYLILNTGTYFVSIFYMIVLRSKDGSVGSWFVEWNKYENPKQVFRDQILTPLLIITLFLPAVLLNSVQTQIKEGIR